MKCYICKQSVSKTQIEHGDAYKLTGRGQYVHHDCGMNEVAESQEKWGGVRPGAGRKHFAKPLQTISVTLYASQVARLNATGNASKALREILK